MASSWSNDELDTAIAALKQAYIEWARAGAAQATGVDGVTVTYTRSRDIEAAIHRLEELKQRNAGTRRPRVEFR